MRYFFGYDEVEEKVATAILTGAIRHRSRPACRQPR